MLARLFRVTMFLVCCGYAARAFANGGACPSGANYLDARGTTLVTLASLGVTNCYYIASNGSDSNDGLSEEHPWAHLPGMPSCTSNCAAVTPNGGMGFIFRGGDTWNSTDFRINWIGSGTATSPIYIGVDQAWHAGTAWARPVWTCGGTACPGMIGFQPNKPYNTIDNIEMTGWLETASNHPTIISACGEHQTIENIYFHGWSADMSRGSAGQFLGTGCGAPSNGTTARFNVADGSDTAKNTGWFNHSGVPIAYGNVMRYVVTGLDGCGDDWHDNLFEYMTNQLGGGHQDAYLQYGPCGTYGKVFLVYNNVLRHTLFPGSGGAGHLWVQGLANCGAPGTPLTNCVGYVFNNVLYDNLPGNMVNTGGHFSVNYGTVYLFNNTFQCGTDSTPGDCVIGDNGNAQGGKPSNGTMAIYSINNHWISQDKSSVLCCNGPAGWGGRGACYSFTCSEKTPVYQNVKSAKKTGYLSGSAYAFEPSKGGATVGSGTNVSSLCDAVNKIDSAAGTACRKDTGYGCTYNSMNHTVSCSARMAVTRPTSGAWDVGAYQSGPKPVQKK